MTPASSPCSFLANIPNAGLDNNNSPIFSHQLCTPEYFVHFLYRQHVVSKDCRSCTLCVSIGSVRHSGLIFAALAYQVICRIPIYQRDVDFKWGSTKVRGVNIGGWLVLEPYVAAEHLGKDSANTRCPVGLPRPYSSLSMGPSLTSGPFAKKPLTQAISFVGIGIVGCLCKTFRR